MRLAWLESLPHLLVVALCAYRLTRLWIHDTLPPLPRLRRAITTWADDRWEPNAKLRPYRAGLLALDPDEQLRLEDTETLYQGEPPLSKLVTCPWCSGFWISAVTVAAACLLPVWLFWPPAAAFAVSAVVGLISARDE